jgi:hypothetical protein
MPIEVDQSVKIEETQKDTILAFSDGQSFSVMIPARAKREAFACLVARKKKRKSAYLMIFSASLFILLREYLTQGKDLEERIIIDVEYSGQETNIKAMFLRHAKAAGMELIASRIVFAQVGKNSRAHVLALEVQRGNITPGYRATLQDLMMLL